MISQQLAEKFREAVAKDYGVEISIEYATQILNGIVVHFDLLARLNHEELEGPGRLDGEPSPNE